MDTDALIDSLAAETPRVSPYATQIRLAIGLLAGGSISMAGLVASASLRPDLLAQAAHIGVWIKISYAASLTLSFLLLTYRLSRPTARAGYLWLAPLSVTVAVMLFATKEFLATPPDQRAALWLGTTSWRCVGLIMVLSLPAIAGLGWAFRRLAPEDPRAAGTSVGLLAGAFAAVEYALACPEHSAMFLVTFYTLGICLAGLIGRLIGPRLLRW